MKKLTLAAILPATVFLAVVLSCSAAFAANPAPAPSTAATPAAAIVKVEMYGTSWCGYCKKARSFFAKNKIPFVEYDVEKDEAAYGRFRKMNPQGGVPFVLIGDKYGISGYQEKAYLQAIELSLSPASESKQAPVAPPAAK